MSAEKDFVFDVIVNKISLDEQTYYLEDLVVDIKFADIDFTITSSRIDVTEFREGRSCSFQSTTEDLRTKLIENPLKATVKNLDDVLGEATIQWPSKLLERLEDQKFASHSHFEEKELTKDGKKVGFIIIICKLQCKCKEKARPPLYGMPLADECGKLKICDQLDKVIDPNDVLFVIGETPNKDFGANTLAQCSIRNCPARLDVSKYKNLRGMLVDDPAVVSPCGNLQCSEIKCDNNDCDEVIREICNKRKAEKSACNDDQLYSVPKFGSEDCLDDSQDEGEKRLCRAENHGASCPNKKARACCCEDSSSTSESGSDSESTVCQPRQIPPHNPINVMPKLVENTPTRPKCCPICNEDVSWLPKYAACPQCGYKAMPYEFKEETYDEDLTADDILAEWGTSITAPGGCKNKKKKVIRCTCAIDGKVCAHCRAKGKIEGVLPKKKDTDVCHRDRSPESSGKDDDEDSLNVSDIVAEVTGATSFRGIPHLTKTLMELKEKFGVGVEKKGKLFQYDYKNHKMADFCEKRLKAGKETRSKAAKPRENSKKEKTAYGPIECKVSLKNKDSNKLCNDTKSNEMRSTCGKTAKSIGSSCFDHSMASEICKAENKKKKSKGPRNKPNKSRLYALHRTKHIISDRHKECVGQGSVVPKNMGWLWSVTEMAKMGWTPGAIRKPIKVLMTHFLKDFPIDNLGVSRFHGKKTVPKKSEEKLVQKPTLHVTKKNGEYLITMRPLKDPQQLEECADPYANVKPIKFKICKNPMVIHTRNVKKLMKQKGYKKCCCGKPISTCCCRNFEEKDELMNDVCKVCKKLKIPNLSTTLVLSDTTDTDSELDIEFTPPVGLVKPFLKKKPDYVCKETQYVAKDITIRQFIKKSNKFDKANICATQSGRRGGGTSGAGGAGGAGGGGGADDDDEGGGGGGGKKGKKKAPPPPGPLAASKRGKGKDGKDGKGGKAGAAGGKDGKDAKKKKRCRLPAKYTGMPKNPRGSKWPVLGDPPPLICMEKHRRHAFELPCGPPPTAIDACYGSYYDPYCFC